jgi:selenocysteine-specific elongation factor
MRGQDLADRIVAERGIVGRDELTRVTGVRTTPTRARTTTTHYVSEDHLLGLRSAAIAALKTHHEQNPLAGGKPTEELRNELGLEPEAFVDVLSMWEGEGLLVRDGAVVRSPGHGSALSGDERSLADRVLSELRRQGGSPSPFAEAGLTYELAKALERTGEVVLVSPVIAYPADTWADVERKVVDLISSNGPATVAQVRDAVGTSRKYAVPLLEKLDATGVTRRHGDVRELGPRGRELASGA